MKPTGEFFATLGQYVYAYIDPDSGDWLYTGKGNGDRCWHHVDDKEYDPEWCHIIARNLEVFAKKDWQSFCIESFLIQFMNPRDNSVSGHYKDCFIMKTLASLFKDHVDAQRDMFKELFELVENNMELFDGRVGFTESRQTSFYIETRMRESTYLGMKFNADDTIRVVLKSNKGGDHFKSLCAGVEDILQGDRPTNLGSDNISFNAVTQEEALRFWADFHA